MAAILKNEHWQRCGAKEECARHSSHDAAGDGAGGDDDGDDAGSDAGGDGCLAACLPACQLAGQLTSQPDCLPASLPTCQPAEGGDWPLDFLIFLNILNPLEAFGRAKSSDSFKDIKKNDRPKRAAQPEKSKENRRKTQGILPPRPPQSHLWGDRFFKYP